MSEDCDIIEPSAAERYLWPEATQNYVRDLEARIEELETALRGVIVLVDTTPPAYPTAIFYLASDALAKGTDDVK